MSDSISRLLLDREVSRDDVDDAVVALGLKLINVVPESSTHPNQLIYATPDRRGMVHLIQDGHIGVAYFTGFGTSAEQCIESLAASLGHYDGAMIDELLAETDRTDELILGLSLAALASPGSLDENRRRAFERALENSDETIRTAAITAITYTSWLELLPLLENAARSSSGVLQLHAQQAIELFTARSE